MGTVLLAWELGGGLGHVMQLRPLAQELARRGHRVVVALRDLSRADGLFPAGCVTLLQAPVRSRAIERPVKQALIFAHILHDSGFEDAQELLGLVRAWRGIYEVVRPDLVLFDYAPAAMLAARGMSFRRAVIGSGFCVPVDESPLRCLRPWRESDEQRLWEEELAVLARMNRVLGRLNQPALSRITQLYGEVDDTFLLTFRELDHYGQRPGAEYRGTWPDGQGEAVRWPAEKGKRVYAYLKVSPGLPRVLGALKRCGCPAVVVLDRRAGEIGRRFECPTMRIEGRAVDMRQAAAECDVAILNAGHGSTAAVLLAGKPVFLLPMWLEQGILARAVVKLGAGEQTAYKDSPEVEERMMRVMESDVYARAARAFAERHAGFDGREEIQRVVERMVGLVGC